MKVGEGGLIMKNWILRKLFFSDLFKQQRTGFWYEAYYEGKWDQMNEIFNKKKGE